MRERHAPQGNAQHRQCEACGEASVAVEVQGHPYDSPRLVGAFVLNLSRASIRTLSKQFSCLIYRRLLQFSCCFYKPDPGTKVQMEVCQRPLQTRPSRRIRRSAGPPGYTPEVLSSGLRVPSCGALDLLPLFYGSSVAGWAQHTNPFLLNGALQAREPNPAVLALHFILARITARSMELNVNKRLNGCGGGRPECRAHRSRLAPHERRWRRRRDGPRARVPRECTPAQWAGIGRAGVVD